MLLVYTHKVTPRLSYIFGHALTRMLQAEVEFTTAVEAFIAYSGPKMTYARRPLGKEFFVRSHDLLFEQGIGDIEIHVQQWEGIPCFFKTSEPSSVPYDIFAASFYLLSRYEEYLPHVRDEHGRFLGVDSLAYKHHFLEWPIVDIWVKRLGDLLKERFPSMDMGKRFFAYRTLIDMSTPYLYKNKGLIRTLGGTLRDLGSFRLGALWMRYKVLLGFAPDPYEVVSFIDGTLHTSSDRPLFFFMLGELSTYDRNVSPNNRRYQSLIKSVADDHRVMLKASYESLGAIGKLKKERDRLTEMVHRPIPGSRQHYNRLVIPDTYRDLIEAEFTQDYTMGYYNHCGFRAGTSTPFYFYDIGMEIQSPLKVVPICTLDRALAQLGPLDAVREKLQELGNRVRTYGGEFNVVFHNYSLGSLKEWKGWKELYVEMNSEFGIVNEEK